jgi:Tol biopolymer transport system component
MRFLELAVGLGRVAVGAVVLTAVAAAQETTCVSVDPKGVLGNDDSYRPSISNDGKSVAFSSQADNLVAGDLNGIDDIFVHDRTTGITECVSVDSSGQPANNGSLFPCISADARFVSFFSFADNLVTGDKNGTPDVFVHDRRYGTTERVSVDSYGKEANGWSVNSSLSADGRFVAFDSDAPNLIAGDVNGANDVFVHDLSSGITECVSVDSAGKQGNNNSFCSVGGISADGRYVVFSSDADNLVAGDTNLCRDVFVHDRTTGITTRISVDSSGAEGNYESSIPSISADGRIVAYWSIADNLVAGDTNGYPDIFVYDFNGGTTDRVSVDSSGAEGNWSSWSPAIAADGGSVAFLSDASNLVAGDTNGHTDVFTHDFASGLTECVSVDSAGVEENANCDLYPSISKDGLTVAFESPATNLVANDTGFYDDIFVHERCAFAASWSNYGAGFPGTYGVPTFTARANPVLGGSLTLDLDNSMDVQTTGLLFIGFQRTQIHSSFGGDLLVLPAITMVISIPPKYLTLNGAIPYDQNLCGFALDLQAWEVDPGAARGLSFTQGLELVFGR